MPKKQDQEQTFEPVHDERGGLRLDRPLTPQEALALDEQRQREYVAQREARFLRASDRREH
jgi:hypothetical protein